MPITIKDEALEKTLDDLGQSQPVPAAKSAVAVAILRNAAEAFVARQKNGDPEAWRLEPAQPVPPARSESDRSGLIRPNQPISRADNSAKSNGKRVQNVHVQSDEAGRANGSHEGEVG